MDSNSFNSLVSDSRSEANGRVLKREVWGTIQTGRKNKAEIHHHFYNQGRETNNLRDLIKMSGVLGKERLLDPSPNHPPLYEHSRTAL